MRRRDTWRETRRITRRTLMTHAVSLNDRPSRLAISLTSRYGRAWQADENRALSGNCRAGV